ncbi:unnamed protein product [Aphanomyces euteiches]|nr:hypothetical protein Ae201684P_017460 [Aphanomyces euteiches]KAH9150840.1 hypothetical protein AeRB84_006401 [Aphanomyces euteiches]
MASFKQLFSAAPADSVEQLLTPKRILYYTFLAFGPGTMAGLYLHSVKLEMENDNEAAKILMMMKARAEVEEEERKEAEMRSQMQTVQSNLHTLQSRLRALEEAVLGNSTAPPLPDVLPSETIIESEVTQVEPETKDLMAQVEAKFWQWWEDENMKEQVDAWWKYLWEDDDDDFFSPEAWIAKISAWWNGDDLPQKPVEPRLHPRALLDAVETWAAVDGSLSWLHNKNLIRFKIEEKLEEAKEAKRIRDEKELAERIAAEARIERRIQEKLEKLQGRSDISKRREESEATRIHQDLLKK